MSSIFNTISEGGQTWAHRIRMLRQVMKIALGMAFFISIFTTLIYLSDIDSRAYVGTWYHLKAKVMENFQNEINVTPTLWEKISNQRISGQSNSLNIQKVKQFTEKYQNYILDKINHQALTFLFIFIVSFSGVLFFFLMRGLLGRRKHHISGKKLVSPRRLAFQLKATGKASDLKIGNIPFVKNTETQHTLITGGTGSGKTNCLHHILTQIRRRKQKTIIVDTTGTFVDNYYDEKKDFIMNPFDDRGMPWSPWVECENQFDFDALAESFIPLSYSDNENYWRSAGRTLFSSLMQKTKDINKNSELTRWMLFESLAKLCEYVQGTKAAAHIDISSEKTAGSIRSVASSFLGCLEFLENTENPFSIKNWIKKDDDSWLFLYCNPAQRSSLNPLLSAWISLAFRGLLELETSYERRIWFVLDELPSLNKIKDLEQFLAEGRKYGGCGLLSLQSPAQLETIYGKKSTQTIIGNCATKIVFSEQDPEVSYSISRSFGEREVKQYQEGISYGAHQVRDGVSLTMQTKSVPIISPTEIQSLKKNNAYVKLPGDTPVTKIRLGLHKMTK